MARKGGKRGERLRQLWTAYKMTKESDPRLPWILVGIWLAVFGVMLAVGFLLHSPILFGLSGALLGVLIALIIFGRRAERAAFRQVEGQPGAAAAVLNSLRRGWTVTPAVAATKNRDVVHRAVGRPGVLLVGEGAPGRIGNLLAAEKRRTVRFVGDAPVYDVTVGNGEGQVPLRKLQRHVMKLPRNLRPAEVQELNSRLRALGGANIPIPKGPLPKNVRLPRSGRLR